MNGELNDKDQPNPHANDEFVNPREGRNDGAWSRKKTEPKRAVVVQNTVDKLLYATQDKFGPWSAMKFFEAIVEPVEGRTQSLWEALHNKVAPDPSDLQFLGNLFLTSEALACCSDKVCKQNLGIFGGVRVYSDGIGDPVPGIDPENTYERFWKYDLKVLLYLLHIEKSDKKLKEIEDAFFRLEFVRDRLQGAVKQCCALIDTCEEFLNVKNDFGKFLSRMINSMALGFFEIYVKPCIQEVLKCNANNLQTRMNEVVAKAFQLFEAEKGNPTIDAFVALRVMQHHKLWNTPGQRSAGGLVDSHGSFCLPSRDTNNDCYTQDIKQLQMAIFAKLKLANGESRTLGVKTKCKRMLFTSGFSSLRSSLFHSSFFDGHEKQDDMKYTANMDELIFSSATEDEAWKRINSAMRRLKVGWENTDPSIIPVVLRENERKYRTLFFPTDNPKDTGSDRSGPRVSDADINPVNRRPDSSTTPSSGPVETLDAYQSLKELAAGQRARSSSPSMHSDGRASPNKFQNISNGPRDFLQKEEALARVLGVEADRLAGRISKLTGMFKRWAIGDQDVEIRKIFKDCFIFTSNDTVDGFDLMFQDVKRALLRPVLLGRAEHVDMIFVSTPCITVFLCTLARSFGSDVEKGLVDCIKKHDATIELRLRTFEEGRQSRQTASTYGYTLMSRPFQPPACPDPALLKEQNQLLGELEAQKSDGLLEDNTVAYETVKQIVLDATGFSNAKKIADEHSLTLEQVARYMLLACSVTSKDDAPEIDEKVLKKFQRLVVLFQSPC